MLLCSINVSVYTQNIRYGVLCIDILYTSTRTVHTPYTKNNRLYKK